ncbi:MAG: hypothetical protein ACYCYQ_07940 [Acidimicrobiales bacterium]
MNLKGASRSVERRQPRSGHDHTGGVFRLLPLIVLALVVAACSTTTSSSRPVAVHRSTTTTVPRTTTTTVPPTTTTTEQPGWTPVSTVQGAIAIDTRTVTEADGASVTIFRFRAGETHFALHVGSTDPPTGSAVIGPDNGSAIGPNEQPILLAAFNGGFQISTGSGGFELNSQVLVPLQTGLASLIIDANGTAHVGVWGAGAPAPGEQVVSVRQNLPPIVVGGQPSPEIQNVSAWGATLGGGSVVARSSLGEDAAGNLLYAASMEAVPSDLANALISAGAVTGMELDINPYWVQLDYAATPGGPLIAGVPGQDRPADQYQSGWTRDFVTVLAP